MTNNPQIQKDRWRYALTIPLILLLGLSFSQISEYLTSNEEPEYEAVMDTPEAPEAPATLAEEDIMEDKDEEACFAPELGLAIANFALSFADENLKELVIEEIRKEISKERNNRDAGEDEFEHKFKIRILDKIESALVEWENNEDIKDIEQDLKELIRKEIESELSNEDLKDAEKLKKDIKKNLRNLLSMK